MPKGPLGLNISSWQRDHWGYTITFKNEAGDLLTGHRNGPAAVAALCDQAIAVDPTYRVVCISSPLTIFSDLCGRSKGVQEKMRGPEAGILGWAKRRHMLHPELVGTSRATERRRHGW